MTDLTNFILERLKEVAPKDLSIDELSALTGAHRNTVSKYLYALEKSGEIQMTRQLGNAKLYTVPLTQTQRTPPSTRD
ncbi:MAG TPA: HTH domain-containing protein [Candidatus Bathyarchaeia archaeon]|nr:HTH domain-containing protein [Candidatus Bathyarchaeia archaeon]